MEANNQTLVVLDERVKKDLAQIKVQLPKFDELSKDEQDKVREYMHSLDINDLHSINKYGKTVFEQSSEEQEAYLQTLKNGEMEIGNIQIELLAAFDQGKPNQNFIGKLISIGKKKAKAELAKQNTVLETTRLLSEKQEKLRNELEQHYYRLQQMSQDSAKERHEIELLIVAAQEKYDEILKRIKEIEAQPEVTFEEQQESQKLKGYLNKLVRKIQGDKTRLITTTTRAITATYLAQGIDEAAFCFEQDMELAKPEIQSTAIFSMSRQIVTGAVETYEKFQRNMNDMASQEAQKSVETLRRINEMRQTPLIQAETLKEICRSTIEASKIVREYHESQKQIPTMGSEYDKIYQDFTKGLQQVMSIPSNNNPKTVEVNNGDEIQI